jgi:hypothetical protein
MMKRNSGEAASKHERKDWRVIIKFMAKVGDFMIRCGWTTEKRMDT